MYLVYKKYDIPGTLRFLYDPLYLFLELSAVFCPRDNAGKLQAEQTHIPQLLRGGAGNDIRSERLRNGGLSDPRLPHQAGVVLHPPQQNGSHAVFFLIPVYHRVYLTAARFFRQIGRVCIQQRRCRSFSRKCSRISAANARKQLRKLGYIHTALAYQPCAPPISPKAMPEAISAARRASCHPR